MALCLARALPCALARPGPGQLAYIRPSRHYVHKLTPPTPNQVAYIRESRDVLRTSASRFSAFEYFYNRSSVAAAMQQELTEALSRWHANVEAFQLLEYQLPSSFAIAIENTEVARQEVEQMLALTLTPTLTLTLTRWRGRRSSRWSCSSRWPD